MSALEKYVLMRQAGFTHDEAERFVNRGIKPNLNTKAKREAFAQLTGGQTSGKKSVREDAHQR